MQRACSLYACMLSQRIKWFELSSLVTVSSGARVALSILLAFKKYIRILEHNAFSRIFTNRVRMRTPHIARNTINYNSFREGGRPVEYYTQKHTSQIHHIQPHMRNELNANACARTPLCSIIALVKIMYELVKWMKAAPKTNCPC